MMALQNNSYFEGGYSQRKRSRGESKLTSLRDDFQKKILKEKEEKLMQQMENDSIRRQQTVQKYQPAADIRNDAFSAPGGVRNFFMERKKNPPSSAGQAEPPVQHQIGMMRRRQGYDKSRPLAPITHVPAAPDKVYSNTAPKKNVDNGFVKWRQEQDLLDKQRRMKAYSDRQAELETENAELQVMKEEEERQRKALLKERETEKRMRQAEVGRRRREESEKKRQQAAEERARTEREKLEQESEQTKLLRQLEDQLQKKQQDLKAIQDRKIVISDGERTTPTDQYEESPFTNKPRKVSRSRKGLKPNHVVYERETTPEIVETAPAVTKMRKPPHTQSSPFKTHKPIQHELNSTYSVQSSPNDERIVQRTPERQEYKQPSQIIDEDGVAVNLEPCENCGRRFAAERLVKHVQACQKASKPRKQFNVSKQRLVGTGAEEFQGKRRKPEKVKPKKDWRSQHKQFIEAIRYAKKVSQIEAEGGNISSIPPPPKSENPDYIKCMHCSRKFNPTAAERHIPKCKDIRAKPTMLMKGKGENRLKHRK